MCLLPAGCSGAPSPLARGGAEAESIATLFTVMAAGGALIWLAVIALVVYATLIRPGPHDIRAARWLIIGGGAVFPVIVLAALLIYGLALMPALRPSLPPDSLRIAVSGEQWWWRVRYLLPDDGSVTLANEIRLPAGDSVEFRLTSPDVIHSFWIPALGGKVDMIPGRTTTLVLTPTRTGTWRGACAEYCGDSHARMNFMVVVMEPAAFQAWLQQQAAPASADAEGQRAFLANGCGACHAVRGTPADGSIGPDLTHVASRLSLAAGALPNHPDALLRWIDHPQAIKPGVNMPAFGMLPESERLAIARYLNELQ